MGFYGWIHGKKIKCGEVEEDESKVDSKDKLMVSINLTRLHNIV